MWGPSFLGSARSISWSLMPWLLAKPGHQHTWYWLCRIGKSLSYTTKDFNNLCHVSVEELDMSTARRQLKSPPWLSGTSAHPTKVTLVNVMVMNGWLTSFSFHVNRLPHSWIKAIWPWNSKVKVISEVKGQGHILYPVSNQCTSFSFHINQTNHSWDMAKIVFDLEKTHPKFLKKIC